MNILEQIEEGVTLAARLTLEVEELSAKLKDASGRLRQVMEDTLPNLMEEGESELFRSAKTGVEVKIEEKIVLNCPAASTRDINLIRRRARIFSWLDEHGYGNLINRELRLVFGKHDEAMAAKVEGYLKGEKLPVSRNFSVHPSTFNKFGKECLAAGIDLPEDFGLTILRKAKIKIPDRE